MHLVDLVTEILHQAELQQGCGRLFINALRQIREH